MVAPYLKCISVWGSIKFLFLFLCEQLPWLQKIWPNSSRICIDYCLRQRLVQEELAFSIESGTVIN